ncbi:MAG: alpha/beta fold hydrolase [Chitinophagaceae bacterium]
MRLQLTSIAWCGMLVFLLMINMQTNAQAPVNNPVAATLVKTAQWTNTFPWKKVQSATDIPNLVNDNNYVDSAKLSTALQSISEKGGGVLYFGSGTYYFSYDLALPSNVIIRGETPAALNASSNGNAWLTKFVFPRLYLDRSNAPKALEPYSIKPKKIWYAGKPDAFTGLVNLDINRAVILLSSPGDNKAVKHTIIYGIRSNNASELDATIPTAIQQQNRQGWQIWPDRAVANINIAAGENCLIAQSLINDQVTDNLAQHDFMTEDGMRFDGSRAEYRVTDHSAINVWSASTPAKNLQVTGNIIHVANGFEPIVSTAGNFAANNQVSVINEKINHVKDGKTASGLAYNLLFKDEIGSEEGIYVSEFNDSLPYRLIRPANYDPTKKYPLVFFLHDFWEKGSDNKRHLRQFVWQFLTDENRNKYPCFIVAPQLPMNEPKWKPDGLGSETWPIQCSSNLIKELAKKFSIDDKRVYAVGNSMGGAGALNLAIQHADQVAAVIAISVFYRMTPNSALEVNKIPMWFIYGEKDDRIEPAIRQSIRTYLRDAKATVKYTEIPNMGHRCWNDVFTEIPDLVGWLFTQRKETGDVAKESK